MLLGRPEAAMQLDIAEFGDRHGHFPGLKRLGFQRTPGISGPPAGPQPDKNHIRGSPGGGHSSSRPEWRGGETLLQAFDRNVRVEKTAESAVDEQTAGNAELHVAQVLDPDPGGHAKCQNDESRPVPVHHHQRTDSA